MTITFQVSPEVEEPLEQQAELAGLPLPEYVRHLVEASVTASPRPAAQSASVETPFIFITPEGDLCVQPETSTDTVLTAALVGERTLGKIWDTPEEEAGCRALLAET